MERSKKLRVKELLEHFKKNENASHKQLFDYYRKLDTDISFSTIRWRIHQLKKKGVIYSLGGGLYSFKPKKYFKPKIDSNLKSLYDSITKNFPHTSFCVWRTPWLNQFMHHQPFTKNIVIEVERYAAKSVFQYVRSEFTNSLFDPGLNEIEDYGDSKSYFITILLSEAPVRMYNGPPE